MTRSARLPSSHVLFFRLFVFGAISLASFLTAAGVSAASLSFTPTSGVFDVGERFTVSVEVTSEPTPVAAVSSLITFPTDKLEVTLVSTSDSFISLWVEEPTFSNTKGTIFFEGIILNPGFVGKNGRVATITFRAKASGNARVAFSQAAVLANDGLATNILKSLGAANFTFGSGGTPSPSSPPPPSFLEPAVPPGAPAAPDARSTTHPDPELWYVNDSPRFEWTLPRGITAVSYAFDDQSFTVPTATRPLGTSVEYKGTRDGVWYFHIRFRNAFGWGVVKHVKVQIDTTPPEPITITFPHGSVDQDNRPVILFNTTDAFSGIDSYDVKVGDQVPLKLLPGDVTESNPYVISPQEPGKYIVQVTSRDRAGNTTAATAEFEILGLNPPQIVHMPERITEGDFLKIEGRTYPRASVFVSLENLDTNKELGEETAFTNQIGQFSLIWPKYLAEGRYAMTAFVIDEKGNKSPPSSAYPLTVDNKFALKIDGWQLTPLIIVGLTILLILLINGLVGYWLYHLGYRKNTLENRLLAIQHELDHLAPHLHEDTSGTDFAPLHPQVKESLDTLHKIVKEDHLL